MKQKNFDIALIPITFQGTFVPPDTRGSNRTAFSAGQAYSSKFADRF